MPLQTESEYWDVIADKSVRISGPERVFTDNSWKRPNQLKNLMAYEWVREKILEIGVGNGVIGGVLRCLAGGGSYTGTELSDKFIEWNGRMYGLNVVKADVREIPGKDYTRIVAFDSLEHVRPEHREEGYRRIYEVAAKGGLLFLHFSYGESFHDKEFDHPFGTDDLVRLEKVGFTLQKYERTICKHPNGDIPYVFVVMSK